MPEKAKALLQKGFACEQDFASQPRRSDRHSNDGLTGIAMIAPADTSYQTKAGARTGITNLT